MLPRMNQFAARSDSRPGPGGVLRTLPGLVAIRHLAAMVASSTRKALAMLWKIGPVAEHGLLRRLEHRVTRWRRAGA